ncbi:MAG: response regulator [Candidatus Goldbacteria bacterium]|nr:response regulator [Candidatus Goldiibacteriota bacterium]
MQKTIIFVDDEPDVRELLEVNLKNAGFKTYGFANSLAMLNELPRIKPDLIILDMMMPKMNGLETCKILKSNPETVKIPVLFLTIKGCIEDIEEAFKAGANAYIVKPFSPYRLIEKINDLLNKNLVR